MSDRRAPAAVVLLVVAVLGCSGPEVISTPLPRETGNVATPSTSPTRVPPTPATTMNPEPSMPAAPPGDVYAVPDPLPPAAPGTPIWAERVAAPEGAVAWRVLYHSRSIRDEDIAVSGLVVVPDRE